MGAEQSEDPESREVFYDTAGIFPGGGIDETLAGLTVLIAKIATGSIVVWLSIRELLSELETIRKRGTTL